MTATTLIRADRLVKGYAGHRTLFGPSPEVRAVDGLSLHIRRGETLGLVGESGCGKSTTGRLLLGLEPADSGTIEFDGAPMSRSTGSAWRRLRARMQMVFQDPLGAMDRRLTIAEQVREPLDIHAVGAPQERPARVAELLDTVGLSRSQGERLPHELSGGQRQRAVLARALATRPDFLVCDEPISALDVSIQAQVMNLFVDIQDRLGTTILFISHDLRAVKQLSHRVAVMYLGTIVEEGPTEDVLRRPRHPYTRALVSAVPDFHGNNRDRILLAGDPPNPANRPSGCPFHPRCPMAVDVCRRETPSLQPLPGSHSQVACLLVSAQAAALMAGALA